MTRKIILFLGMMILLTFTGCESNGRVHDKNYLRAVSVSGDDKKTVTFTFFTKDGKYITTSGRDIAEAKEVAELRTGKKIFTGYTEMIVLDGKNSIDTLEFMLHKWKVSPSCIIAYSENEENIFESSVERLRGSVENAVKQGKAPECDIITVMSGLLGEKQSAQVAGISTEGITSIYTIN
ncbi:MAG: hypothetical protein K2K02_04520 [Ruminococcus sp.]|nr:hypothetical protein [Ruminococcus sp.]MDE6678285.1 hypothetical protein [Ruminococcus sp.]